MSTWMVQMPAANAACRRDVKAMSRCRCRYMSTTEAALRNPNVAVAGPTIYNMVDQDDLTQAVMSNPATGPAIVNYIKTNKRQVKQILGVG